jgi:acyl carrier protein
MAHAALSDAERVEQILDVFAQEARIDRASLRLDARPDELGIESLDMTLALFELEERFGVTIDEPPPGVPLPTVGDIVQQVLARMEAASAGPQGS